VIARACGVSDTGPLHYLVLIDKVEILPQLFTTVLLPMSVRAELDRPETPTRVRTCVTEPPGWLEIRQAPATDDPRLHSVHEGERDAIALAVQIGADLLLRDDRAGVAVARALGLAATGTLGLLVIAQAHGLVDLHTAFAQLRATNFRCRRELMDELLARYGRSP
jgi:predicted nucleic acid-binding protein